MRTTLRVPFPLGLRYHPHELHPPTHVLFLVCFSIPLVHSTQGGAVVTQRDPYYKFIERVKTQLPGIRPYGPRDLKRSRLTSQQYLFILIESFYLFL